MTSINGVAYGPVFTIGYMAIKVDEQGNTTIKPLTEPDKLFTSLGEGQTPLPISLSFFDEGTEVPITQAIEVKRQKGFFKDSTTMTTPNGTVEVKMSQPFFGKESYAVKGPAGETKVVQDLPKRWDNLNITTADGKEIKVRGNLKGDGSAGFNIQTPQGEYQYRRPEGGGYYDLKMPNGETISVLKKQFSYNYLVEMPYGQQFDIRSDFVGNFKVITPSQRVVEIKRDGLLNYKLTTPQGNFKIITTNANKGEFKVVPDKPATEAVTK